MLKNYFTTAIRAILKSKLFSTIHILGLAIGISASLIIYVLVSYHLSFDKFEKDKDRIYRVVSNFNFSGELIQNSGVCRPMGPTLRKEATGIEEVIPFETWEGIKVSVPVDNLNIPIVFKNQDEIIYADESFIKLLGYEWLAGSAKTALAGPNQIVLTQSAAKLYFPKLPPADIIGKELFFEDTLRTRVYGVVKDLPANTDFTFKTFVSRATLENQPTYNIGPEEWGSTSSSTQLLIKLAKGSSVSHIEKEIYSLYDKYHKKDPTDHSSVTYSLQPLSDFHFNEKYGGYKLPLANKKTLFGLLTVAAFLLLLACINFINLSTANSSQRAKEIGIRKTLGSSRRQLILQFLSETFILTMLATILSVLLTPLLLKVFSDFIPPDLHFSLFKEKEILLFLILLIIVVTLLSGFYPALVLSSYKPVSVLKNQISSSTGKTRNAWLRSSLAVLQFVIAQVFIMATILVSKQIYFSVHSALGYKTNAIVYLNTDYKDTSATHRKILAETIRAFPEVTGVSSCLNPPSSGNSWSSTFNFKDGHKEIESNVELLFGDTNYINLYGLKLLAGSNLENSDTTRSFIINETYAHILGFQQPEMALGKYLEYNSRRIPIRGVVADFHQHSLRDKIKPLVIGSKTSNQRNISISLAAENGSGIVWKNALSKIEKSWKEVYPGSDFEYHFFDEEIGKYYTAEQHIDSLLKWSAGLAVFISCLGLLGLVIYTTHHRTKEIGVRKVLGASVPQVVMMITKDFLILILIAFVIAAPVAYLAMHKWLQNFAYPTEISWWIFMVGIVIMILLATITLSYQTIKAARANPVKSLRTE